MDEAVPRRGDVLDLSWDGQRSRLADSTIAAAGRDAGVWAIDRLREYLGENWPADATRQDGQLPGFLLMAWCHSGALGELLNMALRLNLLQGAEGMAKLLRDLQRNPTSDRRVHTNLLLDVAGLAVQQGRSAAFEVTLPGRSAPTDVVVSVPGSQFVVESFVVLTDKTMRDGMAATEWFRAEINRISWTYTVDISADASALPADQVDPWLAEIEMVAAAAQEGMPRTCPHPVAPFSVRSRLGPPSAGNLRGPWMSGGDPRRLWGKMQAKAAQAVKAGGTWIRVDVLDGLWQFTEWSTWTLARRGEAIADLVRQYVADVEGLHGAVVTCGPAFALGEVRGESARISGGGYMLRRGFKPLRARETVIVPVGPDHDAEVDVWLGMYDQEPSWLDWALEQVGLPWEAEVFGRPDMKGSSL